MAGKIVKRVGGYHRLTVSEANLKRVKCKRGHVGQWQESESKGCVSKRCGQCARDRARAHIYGLSPEAYTQLQDEHPVCAICGEDGTDCGRGSLEIDHDHQTTEIRGLLCRRCNIFLGHYESRKHTIPALLRYLSGRQD